MTSFDGTYIIFSFYSIDVKRAVVKRAATLAIWRVALPSRSCHIDFTVILSTSTAASSAATDTAVLYRVIAMQYAARDIFIFFLSVDVSVRRRATSVER